MLLGCSAAIASMVVYGLDANQPIYFGLAASLAGFLLGNRLYPAPQTIAQQA